MFSHFLSCLALLISWFNIKPKYFIQTKNYQGDWVFTEYAFYRRSHAEQCFLSLKSMNSVCLLKGRERIKMYLNCAATGELVDTMYQIYHQGDYPDKWQRGEKIITKRKDDAIEQAKKNVRQAPLVISGV